MRAIRNRSGLLTAIVLTWHVSALAVATMVLTCASIAADSASHAAMSGQHEGMADCPMQRRTRPVCLKHANNHGAHDCDCPKIGCQSTDEEFLALFGLNGILPDPQVVTTPLDTGRVIAEVDASPNPFAAVPFPPPPRA